MGVWIPLLRNLEFCLRPPGEAGESAMDFFHRQMAKAYAVFARFESSVDDHLFQLVLCSSPSTTHPLFLIYVLFIVFVLVIIGMSL